MKKFAKWIKQPAPKAAGGRFEKKKEDKQPEVRSMLLRTYFTSLLCLVLCVSMFFGTSYAWFTSEVNNSQNEIYVGTLKVGLLKEDGTNTLDLAVGENKLFDKNIRWEPGYTTVETVQIINRGDLAFKYVLTFTDGTLENANGKSLADVAQYFNVWVFDHSDNTYAVPGSYEDIVTNDDWEHIGTLADVLKGKTVLSADMEAVRQEGMSTAAANQGTTDGVPTEHKYTIALHMNELATSDVMGQKIKLNVKLVAYQLASEADGLNNDAYDDDIDAAADAAQLKEALEEGTNVVLTSDISLASADERVVMHADILDGNGKTITYNGGKVNDSSVGVVTTSGGRISNLNINGKENGRALYVTKLTTDLIVSDCTFYGAYSFNVNSAVKADNAVIRFTDTNFTSWTSYANVAKHVYFTGCTFGGVLKPYGDTTLTDCTISIEGLDVSALEEDEKITLINCTYNGKLIEKAVLTSDGETVTISGTSAIKLNDGNVVVLASKK